MNYRPLARWGGIIGLLLVCAGWWSVLMPKGDITKQPQTMTVPRIQDLVYCYADAMNMLPLWDIEITYNVDYLAALGEFDPGTSRLVVGHDFLPGDYAATWADPEYFEANIVLDSAALLLLTEEDVRSVVLHELGHIWVWELAILAHPSDADEYDEHALYVEEQLMSWISRWPMWQRVCR